MNEDIIISNQKTRVQIMNEIYSEIISQEMKDRLLKAIDKYSSFSLALDDYNYPLAIEILNNVLANNDILQSDYDMIIEKIPG